MEYQATFALLMWTSVVKRYTIGQRPEAEKVGEVEEAVEGGGEDEDDEDVNRRDTKPRDWEFKGDEI
jgi:hypothetical protein